MREWKRIRRYTSADKAWIWSLHDDRENKGIALVSLNAYATWITPDNYYHKQQFDTVEAAKLAVEMML